MRVKVGELEVEVLSGGRFRLDGGSMFGIVPKTIWSRLVPADDRNRIALDVNCLLFQTQDRRILVEGGCGSKLSEKLRDIYAIEQPDALVEGLKGRGLEPRDINLVIFSHLHFDHCGGGTRREEGRVVPTFPKARYLVQRGEWEDALDNRSIMKFSYQRENLVPLEEAGQVEWMEGNEQILPGLRVLITGGHTRFHQIVLVSSGAETAAYLGDLVPTVHHLRPVYNMAYDMYPYENMTRKIEVLQRACDERWIVFFDHEPNLKAARIRRDEEGNFEAVPLSPEELLAG